MFRSRLSWRQTSRLRRSPPYNRGSGPAQRQKRRSPDRAAINKTSSRRECASDLLEFDQGAEEVLRMQKQDRLAMRADLWIATAENPGT